VSTLTVAIFRSKAQAGPIANQLISSGIKAEVHDGLALARSHAIVKQLRLTGIIKGFHNYETKPEISSSYHGRQCSVSRVFDHA
jgi:hypothetical protein